MPAIHREAIAPHSAERMFYLVNDVNRYHEFVPWCADSQIVSQDSESLCASLTLSAKGFQKKFTTRNHLYPYHTIELELVDGPFKRLAGAWTFDSLGPEVTKVMLDLDFELSNRFIAAVFGSLFEQVTKRLVDAFIERAGVLASSE